VRAVLARLDGFANEHNIAILGIMHPPKTVAGVKAINAVTGAQALHGSGAHGLSVTPDAADPERRLTLCIKNNLGAKTDGLAYRIKTLIVSLNVVAPFLSWDSSRCT
jgi:hypothetical protein